MLHVIHTGVTTPPRESGRAAITLAVALLLMWSLAPTSSAELAPPPLCGTVVPIGCETWSTVFDDHSEDSQPTEASSPDGSHVFVAFSTSSLKLIVVSYDSQTGAPVWTTTFTAPDYSPGERMMVVSPDGARLYVVGTLIGGPGGLTTSKGLTLALDASNGTIAWNATVPANSFGYALAVSPDGTRVYTTGERSDNYVTVAYDSANGNPVWSTSYDGEGGTAPQYYPRAYDSAFSIATSSDGGAIYVTGISASAPGPMEYATLAYDAATGAQRWLARYHGQDAQGAPTDSEAYSLVSSPINRAVYVLGSAGAVAYDSLTGEMRWANQATATCPVLTPRGVLRECVVKLSPDGTRLFAGTPETVAAYDTATGSTLWALPIHVSDGSPTGAVYPTPQSDFYQSDITLSPDGSRVYLTDSGGHDVVTDGRFGGHYETFSLNATNGHPVWRVVAGNGFQQVWMVTAAPDGAHVFVTGESYGNSMGAIMTVAYNTNLGLESAPKLPS